MLSDLARLPLQRLLFPSVGAAPEKGAHVYVGILAW